MSAIVGLTPRESYNTTPLDEKNTINYHKPLRNPKHLKKNMCCPICPQTETYETHVTSVMFTMFTIRFSHPIDAYGDWQAWELGWNFYGYKPLCPQRFWAVSKAFS